MSDLRSYISQIKKTKELKIVKTNVSSKFENGYFVSVTEGSNKLGSMVVSLATGPTPITTTIIPSRSESLFLKLIAERISTKMRGIALVSTFIQKQLESDTAKTLMSEIMEMIENEWFKKLHFTN